jgi:hypothetical protein
MGQQATRPPCLLGLAGPVFHPSTSLKYMHRSIIPDKASPLPSPACWATGSWKELLHSGAAEGSVVIINVYNGPGETRCPVHVGIADMVRQAKDVTLLGYVHTLWGKRDLTVSRANVMVQGWQKGCSDRVQSGTHAGLIGCTRRQQRGSLAGQAASPVAPPVLAGVEYGSAVL